MIFLMVVCVLVAVFIACGVRARGVRARDLARRRLELNQRADAHDAGKIFVAVSGQLSAKLRTLLMERAFLPQRVVLHAGFVPAGLGPAAVRAGRVISGYDGETYVLFLGERMEAVHDWDKILVDSLQAYPGADVVSCVPCEVGPGAAYPVRDVPATRALLAADGTFKARFSRAKTASRSACASARCLFGTADAVLRKLKLHADTESQTQTQDEAELTRKCQESAIIAECLLSPFYHHPSA